MIPSRVRGRVAEWGGRRGAGMSESRDARGRDTSGDLGPLMELVCLATARKGTRHFPLFALSFSLPFFFLFFFSFFFFFRCVAPLFFFPFSGRIIVESFSRFLGFALSKDERERSAGLCWPCRGAWNSRYELACEFGKDRNFFCFC